jgi:hypothetical protein
VSADVTPDLIMRMGLGYASSRVLFSAVELGLFTTLGNSALTGAELERALALHPRGTFDFLDTLVALGLLDRDGNGAAARYKNTPATAVFLDRNNPRYVGGILEMHGNRIYEFWGDLTEALQTGKPQNEMKTTGKPMFEAVYADPVRLEQFMNAMAGTSMARSIAFAEKFDFSGYKTLADIGGATAQLACFVAERHPHLTCRSYDLAVVQPIAQRHIQARGLETRVQASVLNFLKEDLPRADVITMGMILHDWNLATKKMLIAKAFRALPEGGALVAIENIIDDERRKHVPGLIMSLMMLIEFGDAFDFTGADFTGWCLEAGFRRCEIVPLAGPVSAAIAYK